MAMKKKSWVIIGISVGVLVVLIAVSKILSGNKRRKGASVEYVIPQRRTIVQTITANGRIRPEVVVKISPEVSGRLRSCPLWRGSR